MKWKSRVGTGIYFSSPRLSKEGILYVGTIDGLLVAVNTKLDGAIEWKFKTDGPFVGTALIMPGFSWWSSNFVRNTCSYHLKYIFTALQMFCFDGKFCVGSFYLLDLFLLLRYLFIWPCVFFKYIFKHSLMHFFDVFSFRLNTIEKGELKILIFASF